MSPRMGFNKPEQIPMSEAVAARGVKISLKWLLIGVPLAGATIGMLGRLFYSNPNHFRLAIVLLLVLTPFLLAVGTIVRLSWRTRRRGQVAWGLLLAISPLVGYGILTIANHLYGAHGYGVVDNTTLIKQRLPNEITTPWIWQEFERRMQAGSLSQAEVEEVIYTLTAHMKLNNQPGFMNVEGNFIKLAAQNKLVSQQTLFGLCDAYHFGDPPELDHFSGMPGFRGDFRIGVEFGNHWGMHSELPIKLIWYPSKVLVDGKQVPFSSRMSHGRDWDGEFGGNFDVGIHELTVELECAYVDNTSFSPFEEGCIEKKKWPKQLHKTWTTSVSDQKHLHGIPGMRRGFTEFMSGPSMGEPNPTTEVKLVTRASDDPLANNAVQVERIFITPEKNNVSTVTVQITVTDELSLPISCDVTARIDGETFEFGTFYAGKVGQRKFRTAAGYQTRVGNVDKNIKSAEVTLTPDANHIRRIPEVKEIWGKPIIIRNVPIEHTEVKNERTQSLPTSRSL